MGLGASKEESWKIFDTFVKAGGNFIDTANKYTEGTSEKMVGEFIASERESFVMATKFSLNMKDGDPNWSGNHRKNMVQSLEASLKRLNTDYIDLYWLHAWDFLTPVEEVMRALDDMVRAGKVLYTGISDTPAWIVSWANMLADLKGWTRFVGLQVQYSLVQRTIERDLLPMANTMDIAVTPWGVLGSGLLSGKFNKGNENSHSEDSRIKQLEMNNLLNERNMTIAGEVSKIAEETGHSPSQVALNWVRQQHGVIIPIIGARRIDQLKDNLRCLDFRLNDEQLKRLDDISKIELGFPHDFLQSDMVQNLVYGGTRASIDNHRG
jgi:aryl-alcohol dehydrogenase-like predicted oxidoreductase